jgi:hypothetical protein
MLKARGGVMYIYRVNDGKFKWRGVMGLGDRCELMDSCKAGALSGVMVASMTGRQGSSLQPTP